ncbi:MAG: PRC-barrel domain-containing protein [Proteobacteria bacterium]|nr:PRC-barrel domain-containing protein [Pseudomonadota bacterium]
MKRMPLLFAALAPFAALAAQDSNQKVDQQELKDDYRVTRILGAEIHGGDGSPIGMVEDVIFGLDGNVDSLLVQRDVNTVDAIAASGDATEESAEQGWENTEAGTERSAGRKELAERDATRADAEVEREQGADIVDAGRIDREDSGAEAGDAFASLRWTDVSYDAGEEILRMNGDAASMQSVADDQPGEEKAGAAIRASRLVGLEVHLSDERSFGEVEDVLIDSRSGKASAIVVDSMEFFDKERYALPVNLEGIDMQDESLSLQLTRQNVKDMGEFEMEEVLSRQ